jgi:hypothetical protein
MRIKNPDKFANLKLSAEHHLRLIPAPGTTKKERSVASRNLNVDKLIPGVLVEPIWFIYYLDVLAANNQHGETIGNFYRFVVPVGFVASRHGNDVVVVWSSDPTERFM